MSTWLSPAHGLAMIRVPDDTGGIARKASGTGKAQLARMQLHRQLPCREPDVGLDFGTPGSHRGPKAGAKPLSHPGIPHSYCLRQYFFQRSQRR